ncbi:MAG: NAD(P)/FAD-dependent oxidoreductase [Casimicrobiaceae bacterium]
MRSLRGLVARAQRARRDAQSTPAERAAWRTRAEQRREFLGRALALAASGSVAGVPARAAARVPVLREGTRVIVVGGGLAGLAALRELADAGIAATLVEASPRVGGRCWTERRAFDDGQIAERGGELVDTSHDVLIDLCATSGIPLDDLLASEPRGSAPAWVIDGAPYSQHAANADLLRMLPALDRDARALAPDLPTYRRHRAAQLELDRMSAAGWIDTRVDGGQRSRFGRLLANAYVEELGGDLAQISAMTVVALLNGTPREHYSPYEESDQRYHVRGGNDRIVDLLSRELEARIETGARLTALARLPDGRYRVTTARDAAVRDDVAERVVLALPFTLLREVDLGGAGLRPRKLAAIRELGMGRNTKLQLQFRGRPWYVAGGNGETRIEGSYMTSWDVTRAQQGAAGILNFYSGGTTAAPAGEGSPEERARDVLADLERAYPGIAGAWNGKAIRNAWDRHPWTRGSYALLMPGQYVAFHGAEWEPEGGLHFAGEHTSADYSGYMNGALESGRRAAQEAVRALALRQRHVA